MRQTKLMPTTSLKKYLQKVLVFVLPISAFVYYSTHSINNYRPAASAFDYAYTNLRDAEAPDLTPVNPNRELIYHEWPFDGSESVGTRLGTAFMLLGSFYSSAKDYSKAINAYTNSIAHSKNEQF